MSGIVYCVHKKELNRKQSVVSQTLKCDTLCEDFKSHIFHPWLGSCYFVCVSESFLFFLFFAQVLFHFLTLLRHILPFPSCLCRCCECGCILSHWYYEREGQLYCKKHYWCRYGGHCHGCKETIATGLIMVILKSLKILTKKKRF